MAMTENDNKVNTLMRSAVFRDLPGEALNAIARAVHDLVAPQHILLCRKGDPGDSLYLISSGRVRIFGRNEKGVEIDLSIQGPSDTFGEMSLLTGESMYSDDSCPAGSSIWERSFCRGSSLSTGCSSPGSKTLSFKKISNKCCI